MYNRFLNNNDYLSLETKEHLEQLTRGNEDRLIEAEQAAEMSILEYLSENFNIEDALNVGKNIREYNNQITYPVNSIFKIDNKIYKVIKGLSGILKPSSVIYWTEDQSGEIIPEEIDTYLQLQTYQPNDIVKYNGVVWICQEANGYEFDNIQVPGIIGWNELETYSWEALNNYNLWEVVKYGGLYYALIKQDENYDALVNPRDSDYWGLIGNYDDKIFTYEFSEHEYVVFEDKVFYPTMEVNPDIPTLKVNIYPHDPRNQNIKKHMLQLAIYELYKLISPNNVSSVRITDYETSIQWLRDASRLKLNPQIPRKIDEEDNKPTTDYQIATFMKDYDPNQNVWQI